MEKTNDTNVPWRKQPKGFPYKGDILCNSKYLKDRRELFRKSGNGWWWYPNADPKPYNNRGHMKEVVGG